MAARRKKSIDEGFKKASDRRAIFKDGAEEMLGNNDPKFLAQVNAETVKIARKLEEILPPPDDLETDILTEKLPPRFPPIYQPKLAYGPDYTTPTQRTAMLRNSPAPNWEMTPEKQAALDAEDQKIFARANANGTKAEKKLPEFGGPKWPDGKFRVLPPTKFSKPGGTGE